MSSRFRDSGVTLGRFAGRILVRCPSCDGRATVFTAPDDPRTHRRLSCLGCGHAAVWEAPRRGNARCYPSSRGPVEPWFGRPVWLQAPVRGHVLWAFNQDHLDLLDGYLAAELRERGSSLSCCNISMIARLPAWMKSAKNRDEVLRAIRRLRTMLPPPAAHSRQQEPARRLRTMFPPPAAHSRQLERRRLRRMLPAPAAHSRQLEPIGVF